MDSPAQQQQQQQQQRTSSTADAMAQGRQATLPTTHSTASYWHREPSQRLLGHRTTAQVPGTADVVVVGSGMTGAFAARRLAEGGRDVLMLEAREACWGATGRNGGHCQPGVWTSSAAVARFELATFHQLAALVAEADIACDWRVVGGVHALFSAAELDAARQQVRRLQKHPDLRDKAELVEEPAALAELRVPGAVGAVYQPVAATCWPYKLVAWVLEQLLHDHAASGRFNLQTGTPVLRLHRRSAGAAASGPGTKPAAWVVDTPRGPVVARDVLLAINAYTSYLVPRLAGLIVPVRGQMCALRPPPGAVALRHSHGWLAAGGSDDYLIQRGGGGDSASAASAASSHSSSSPPRDEAALLLLGGERMAGAGAQEGISCDDGVDAAVGRALRRALAPALKLRPEGEGEAAELKAAQEWTGIMGYSRDRHPWVGRVPAALLLDEDTGEDTGEGKGYDDEAADGLWLSAGYTGHGMPVAARCGVAVADMVLGAARPVAIPAEFGVSGERVARARRMALPQGSVVDMLAGLGGFEQDRGDDGSDGADGVGARGG